MKIVNSREFAFAKNDQLWYFKFILEEGFMMKKMMLSLCLGLLLVAGVFTVHVHDEHCGYNPETGEGCMYSIVLFEKGKHGN